MRLNRLTSASTVPFSLYRFFLYIYSFSQYDDGLLRWCSRPLSISFRYKLLLILFEQTNERFRNIWDLPKLFTVIIKKGEPRKNSVWKIKNFNQPDGFYLMYVHVEGEVKVKKIMWWRWRKEIHKYKKIYKQLQIIFQQIFYSSILII